MYRLSFYKVFKIGIEYEYDRHRFYLIQINLGWFCIRQGWQF